MSDVPNTQRALWAALLIMLVAPFLAGMLHATMALAAPLLSAVTGPQPAAAPLAGEPLGVAVARTYVWAAMPSALSIAALLPMILKRGTFGWIEAGAVGVVAFAAANVLAPLPVGAATPATAFAFGVILIAVRQLLVGRILRV